MSTLFIVATPLGNLKDISQRALDTLQSVDLILAEDTRVSQKLLSHYTVKNPLKALHKFNERQNTAYVLAQLEAGLSVALISDAGTPAVSDPGAKLVAAVAAAGFKIVPIPGASAITTAISAAGLTAEHFYFAGFLPTQKKARRSLLETLAPLPAALVFYEAPHRVKATLRELADVFPSRPFVIARELTKTFETIAHVNPAELDDWLAANPEVERGELVLMVDVSAEAAKDDAEQTLTPEILRWIHALAEELPPAKAAKIVANVTGADKAAVYRLLMK
jgi:16S rRNA (cytidine1402-2'-O)-methyltransferase